jgi:hypothetical protein
MEVVSRSEKVAVESVTIELSSMEAGWLRRILLFYAKVKGLDGFGGQLFRKLDKFYLRDYEEQYPDWRKE